MIASISQGGGFGGLFGYLLALEKSAKIIGGNVACRSATGLTREFKAISDLNPQVTVVAKHIALAFAPEDGEVANSLKAEIASMFTRKFAGSVTVLVGGFAHRAHLGVARMGHHSGIERVF